MAVTDEAVTDEAYDEEQREVDVDLGAAHATVERAGSNVYSGNGMIWSNAGSQSYSPSCSDQFHGRRNPAQRSTLLKTRVRTLRVTYGHPFRE